jgi:hypothetical protein
MKMLINKVEKACVEKSLNIARKASGAIRIQGIAGLWLDSQ